MAKFASCVYVVTKGAFRLSSSTMVNVQENYVVSFMRLKHRGKLPMVFLSSHRFPMVSM